ncbi:hypothetical protein ACIBAG_05805 [Streptomyces sp. NPDC051243]|uniref:hypothetical protein n=1 Tax=Streptomyces sp. NPDC051243 TaxID=3365646 RepID=UPI0037AC2084
MAATAVATVLFAWSTLWSLLLSRSHHAPEVTRIDGPEPTGVRHGRGTPSAEGAG